jgi:uncharacterized membrane protein
MMKWVSIAFWLLLGLFFLGISFPYLEIIIGILAIIIALSQLDST